MYTIGAFTKKDAGYQGTIKSLGLKAKAVSCRSRRPTTRLPISGSSPTTVEFGAAWQKTAEKSGNPS